MLIAKLNGDNTVASVFRAKGITDDNGVQHPVSIFRGSTKWADADLNDLGYAVFEETKVPSDKVSTGYSDVFSGGRVTRTHTLVDKPVDRSAVKAAVKRQRDFVRDAGIDWVDSGATDYVVQTDNDSRREIIGAVVGINENGDTEQIWRMQDNTLATLPAADFKAMAIAVRDHVNACYVRQAQLEGMIDAAADDAAVKAIDITAGWPAHYVEASE